MFFVRYLPYPAAEHRLAAPIPDYRGWTDERMERDMRRFADIGIDGVLLQISWKDFQDSFRSGRLRHFMVLAGSSTASPPVKIIPYLDASSFPGAVTLSYTDLARWTLADGAARSPALWRPAGRMTWVVDPRIRLSGNPHPACSVIRSGTDFPALSPALSGHLTVPGRFSAVLVVAGWRGDRNARDSHGRPVWQIPRRNGQTLREELWRAFESKPRMVIVSSWNDFLAGDFIEPNSLDGTTISEVLQAEIARVHAACQPPPVVSP